MIMLTFIILVLIGYLIGSIPSSYLSMRLFTGKDIRAIGTGNATVTAVLMHGGKRPALVAFIAEITKGAICILIAYLTVGELWASFVILVAAVFGCSWSIWLRGGGGQGMTIGMSGLVLINVLAVLIMAAWYIIPLVVTRRHVLSNRLFRISVPVVLGLWYTSWEYALAGCLLVMPSFVKELRTGDDIVKARKADGV
jgi:acyl phosphate:glycerol-3-phosphate acyltransferase